MQLHLNPTKFQNPDFAKARSLISDFDALLISSNLSLLSETKQTMGHQAEAEQPFATCLASYRGTTASQVSAQGTTSEPKYRWIRSTGVSAIQIASWRTQEAQLLPYG